MDLTGSISEVGFWFFCCLIQFMWSPFSHLLDLSHGFQVYYNFTCQYFIDLWIVAFKHHLLSNNYCNFTIFSGFFSHSSIFKFYNHSNHSDFRRTCLTLIFDKHSLLFHCSFFFQMVTENEYCSQIVILRHIIDMFNAVKNYAVVWNLYCALKIFC